MIQWVCVCVWGGLVNTTQSTVTTEDTKQNWLFMDVTDIHGSWRMNPADFPDCFSCDSHKVHIVVWSEMSVRLMDGLKLKLIQTVMLLRR